jgi:exopolysaccharide production protein ExoY
MSLDGELLSLAAVDIESPFDYSGWKSAGLANVGISSVSSFENPERAPVSGEAAVKRLFDIVVAFTLLVLVAPFLPLLILLLKIDSPGPIFFVQQRVGRDGVLFPCIKLRTMVADARARLETLLAESPSARAEWERDHKLRNDPRTTAIGKVVRKFSLDELPQLVNILLGHMSIVGPRPIVESEIGRYGIHFADYCSVRPGLTGLWQVNGRNDTTYDERVQFDRDYARNKSFAFDLKIIARSIPVVMGARGAY